MLHYYFEGARLCARISFCRNCHLFLNHSGTFLPGKQPIKSPATSRSHTGSRISTSARLRLCISKQIYTGHLIWVAHNISSTYNPKKFAEIQQAHRWFICLPNKYPTVNTVTSAQPWYLHGEGNMVALTLTICLQGSQKHKTSYKRGKRLINFVLES